jgi:hypothetical protein
VVSTNRGSVIAIGKSWHIMRYAAGLLYQDGHPVAEVKVRSVDVEESTVEIVDGRRVDYAKLKENGNVVLFAPVACRSKL